MTSLKSQRHDHYEKASTVAFVARAEGKGGNVTTHVKITIFKPIEL